MPKFKQKYKLEGNPGWNATPLEMRCAFCLEEKPQANYQRPNGLSDTCKRCEPKISNIRALVNNRVVKWEQFLERQELILESVGRTSGYRFAPLT